MSRGSGQGVGRGPVLWRLEGRCDLDFSLAWGPFLEPLQPLPLPPPPSLYQDRREDTGPPGNPGSPHLRGLHFVPCAKSQFCCGRHRGSSPRGRTRPSRGDVTLLTIVSSTLPERFPQRLPSAVRRPPAGAQGSARTSAPVRVVPPPRSAALGPEGWPAAGVTGTSRWRACRPCACLLRRSVFTLPACGLCSALPA